jgi:hypothetical protein
MPDDWDDSNKVVLYDDEKSAALIHKAQNGDAAARYVLYDVAAKFVESGRSLPERLRAYIVGVLSSAASAQHVRRGRNPYAKHPRNFDIALAVREVVVLGFRPTRNAATEAASACSIVKQALETLGIHMTEKNVEKIWERFSRDLP